MGLEQIHTCRSCESQIISMIHQFANNNDENIQTYFAKAFDKVPH